MKLNGMELMTTGGQKIMKPFLTVMCLCKKFQYTTVDFRTWQMIGVWSMCLWEQMGHPKKVNLVELGPGRGTLMADLLRGTAKFKEFSESLSVHLVECSPALIKLQHSALQCTEEQAQRHNNKDGNALSSLSGAPVSWHADLEQVPRGGLPDVSCIVIIILFHLGAIRMGKESELPQTKLICSKEAILDAYEDKEAVQQSASC
eukprot:Gb_32770 [translate_table: standard]